MAATTDNPGIKTAAELGLAFQNLFGPLGPEEHVTLHHTAGPTDGTLTRAYALCRQYHVAHKAKGWGGIGYHYCLPRTEPVIICLRPVTLKGAHTGGWNTGNVGVMCHGTTGDRPTKNQVELFRWLLSHADTREMPFPHRTDRPINKPHADRRGHQDWPGHGSNACPGTHKPLLHFRTFGLRTFVPFGLPTTSTEADLGEVDGVVHGTNVSPDEARYAANPVIGDGTPMTAPVRPATEFSTDVK
jgi:hypothetical protein